MGGSNHVLTTLPSVAEAKLPELYERARVALADCYRIDECKDWANKAMALASYARQSNDDTLYKTAGRIQGRAIRRCGELLKQFDARGNHRKTVPDHLSSRIDMAKDAGMSEHQMKTAVRLANVPGEEFEALVDSENPPTVKQLAERGKNPRPKPLFDLEGRDPQDFSRATKGQAAVDYLAEIAEKIPAEIVVKGTLPHEVEPLLERVEQIAAWLNTLKTALKKELA